MSERCDSLRVEALALAALAPTDRARAEAEAHARSCPGCAEALREAGALLDLVGQAAIPDPGSVPLPVSGIVGELRREGRRRAWAAALAALLAVVLVLATARHPSRSWRDLVLAATLGGGALLLAAGARRWKGVAAGLALVLAAVAAAASGRSAVLAPAVGLHCLAIELGAGALVVGAVWLALRGSATRMGRSIGAAAAAGALAGGAGLQLACEQSSGLPHQLVFHLGGVVLALAAGVLLTRRSPAR